MRLGYNTAGTEETFERVLRARVVEHLEQPREPGELSKLFVYLEIGIAEGQTLKAVADVLSGYPHLRWNAIGIDLISGPFFNAQTFLSQCAAHRHNVEILHTAKPDTMEVRPTLNAITVALLNDDESAAEQMFPYQSIHFAVIDGCHGAPCVRRDFEAIERAMAQGGIVAFHDAMPEDQGQGYQPHCKQNINVRQALMDLELLPKEIASTADYAEWSKRRRSAWDMTSIAYGDKSANPPGNGFMFFRKTQL
jgi:hypothetical protein